MQGVSDIQNDSTRVVTGPNGTKQVHGVEGFGPCSMCHWCHTIFCVPGHFSPWMDPNSSLPPFRGGPRFHDGDANSGLPSPEAEYPPLRE